jgi:regulator of replication initiation timing
VVNEMGDLEEKVHDLEMKVQELEQQLDHMEEFHSYHLDENDVRAVVDRLFTEKKLASKEDVEGKIDRSHLQLIKWIIGTGISVGAVVVSILHFI